MLNIKIIAIDTIKKNFFSQAIEEYLKRLKPFAKLEIIEIKAESFGASNKEQAKQKEEIKIEKILKKINSKNIFLLSEQGREHDSLNFAKFLDKNEEAIFIIGGALGFSDSFKNKYAKISLSQLTLPHELARVVLLEQIYRAITILKNKEYHY